MKKTFIRLSIACLCAGLVFTSCSKSSDDNNNVAPATESQQTAAGDDTRAQNESDAGASDAETAISSNGSTRRTSGASLIEGATIDGSDSAAHKRLVIMYDGSTTVGGRKRSGSITAQLTSGTSWDNQNAVITITYNNYKATRVSDGKTITINGSCTYQNTSGGSISTMTIIDSRTRTIRSTNMSVTFDDNTQRTWSVAKKRVITCQTIGSSYTIKTYGDTIIAGHSNDSTHVAVWGKTRFGTTFYTLIVDNDPITWKTSSCTSTPTSGIVSVQGLVDVLTIKYGVDASGTATTTNNCSYGIKVSWASSFAILGY